MTALLLLLVPLLQDTHELQWKLKEGQAFACAWTLDLKGPGMDVTMEVKGTLTVRKTGAEGAQCELSVARYAMKGKIKEEVDVLFENGVLKRPDPGSPGGKKILADCLKPLAIKVTPRGKYEAKGPHVLQPLFGGQSDVFGSQLPEKAVAEGGEWEGVLQSPSGPPVQVKYKLEECSDARARISLENRQEIKAGAQLLEYSVSQESVFDVREGRCVRSKADIGVVDKTDPKREPPASPDITTVITFEMAPATAIDAGKPAPDFAAKNQKNVEVKLSELLKSKRNVLLAFYPKDFTGG